MSSKIIPSALDKPLDEKTASAIREALWDYIPGPMGAAVLVMLQARESIDETLDYTYEDARQLADRVPELAAKLEHLKMRRRWLHLWEFLTKQGNKAKARGMVHRLLHIACNKVGAPFYDPKDFRELVGVK